ncbi:MAG: CGGC domain-containing protein [Thermodesulfobacteriota bacterium]
MKVWNSSSFSEEPTKIHLAQCLINCPHTESVIVKLEAKCHIEIVKGTHPYQMGTLFG